MNTLWVWIYSLGLFDDISIVVGIGYAIIRHYVANPHNHPLFSTHTVKTAAHGMSLVPILVLLAGSMSGKFAPEIITFLLGTSRVVLALTALFALAAILGND